MTPLNFFNTPGLVRPMLTADQALELASERFGVTGDVTEVGSQQDRNFRIGFTGKQRYLLKISNRVFDASELEAQNLVMRTLADAGLRVPTPVTGLDGTEIQRIQLTDDSGNTTEHLARLLRYVEGQPLINHTRLSPEQVRQLGELSSTVSSTLAGLDHPGLHRVLQWDLQHAIRVISELAPNVRDPQRRALVLSASTKAAEALEPLTGYLPRQAIHGDLTDDNVVCEAAAPGREARITGIIDFGDAMYSWRVAELVVTCTSVIHHDPSDLTTMLPAIVAFDRQAPLTDAELCAFWPLLVLRGAVLVVSGEQQAAIDPDNAYAVAALEREWSIFEAPATADWELSEHRIRHALGRRTALLATPPNDPAPLLPPSVVPTVLDLSTASDGLNDGAWLQPDAERKVISAATRNGATAVTTAFGQARLTRSSIHSQAEPENVALFCRVEFTADEDERAPETGSSTQQTQLRAPFDGHLRQLPDGETVALEGADAALLVRGLSPLPEEQSLQRGEAMATAMAFDVQLCAQPRDEFTEFARASDFPFWATLFYDPSHLLNVPASDVAVTAADLLLRRSASYAPLQAHYYAEPPQIERGWREHLIDTAGRVYLDMVNNVTILGHGRREVADAAADQWARLNTNSRFHYAAVAELSERLLAKANHGLANPAFDTVLLVNSGSEAVDLALRLSKAFTGRQDVMCVHESYHGWSFASDAVSTSVSDNPLADQTRPGWVHPVDAPNDYRGIHRGDGAGEAYASDLIRQLTALAEAGSPIGTYLAEPRNGNAGAIAMPTGYLPAVYEAVRARGGVCISDEVQVGYGRLGAHFWGFQEHGVVPDIVTVAKAMGNGHPLGAVITRGEIAGTLAEQGSFFSSAGGSTLSCRIGLTVLDVIEKDGLQANAERVGAELRARLLELAERHPVIGAVHGAGLYLGIELVRDRETREPADAETDALCNRMLQLGVIIQPTGDRGNVLKVKPPLTFDADSLEFFVSTLGRALSEIGGPA